MCHLPFCSTRLYNFLFIAAFQHVDHDVPGCVVLYVGECVSCPGITEYLGFVGLLFPPTLEYFSPNIFPAVSPSGIQIIYKLDLCY